MSVRLSKLRQRIIVLSVAVFILVSASSSSASRCYWCGPLAEQVHRSQRAPPCNTFHLEPHETDCDPGYSHCAIVATSPPYAESRLCVKFYQDECYSLYCNSTKTWRMVCACQGDLCNGPHTERENEAFALVPKFAKNKSRNKRSTANIIKTKNVVEENTIIIMGKAPNDAEALNDQPTQDKMNEQIEQGTNPNYEIKIQITPTPKKAEDYYMIVHSSLTNFDKNDVIKTESHDVSKTEVEPTMPDIKDKNLETTKMDTYIETTKMDMDTYNVSDMVKAGENAKLNDEKINNNNNTETNEDNPETKISTQMDKPLDIPSKSLASKTTSTSTKQTTTEMSVEVQTSETPGKMPPAENMQQNTTPTKAIEVTTMDAVVTTESLIGETTTIVNNTEKSGGIRNLAHAMVFVVCFFAKYCV